MWIRFQPQAPVLTVAPCWAFWSNLGTAPPTLSARSHAGPPVHSLRACTARPPAHLPARSLLGCAPRLPAPCPLAPPARYSVAPHACPPALAPALARPHLPARPPARSLHAGTAHHQKGPVRVIKDV
ncbi:hypothetical protein FIBSPDRAFT_890219 [Athelia psychrophila]|uniref:Uncharacterized protein n=1 Tax=Athelia psychrophila TaxID=1759441 RepID=A0A166L502_9AGAM|nr:hypothetical protein FIBSPDRAFT_890219 [Fibularhizoctonia sp. CBS 109695]